MQRNQDFDIDTVIIGAGVIGCCVARELARYDLEVLVLEAGSDIACGATRANSGIIHAGFDPLPGTLKAKFNVEGSRLYPGWAEQLGFSFQQNGSMVIARNDAELGILQDLLERGKINGVKDLRIIDGTEALVLEPSLAPDVVGALVAPTAGICDPYEVALKALENAVNNGARVKFNSIVNNVESINHHWRVITESEEITCKVVVNAAGVFADEINNEVGAPSFSITPVKGEYILYDSEFGNTFSHTIFQVPTAAGKGVLVSPTVHGNLFIGPNSYQQTSKNDLSTTTAGLKEVLNKAKISWPNATSRGIITNFAGLRASGESGDFILGPVESHPGFYNAACIDSPGLSTAPAIAVYLSHLISSYLHAGIKNNFNPCNNLYKEFSNMDDLERAAAIKKDPLMGEIVCRCCKVTEAEIVRVLHGSVPALTLDTLKWRSRSMMGRCHGGFCTPAILRIMSRELNVSPDFLGNRFGNSQIITEARNDYLELTTSDSCSSTNKDLLQNVNSTHGLPAVIGGFDVVVVGGGAAGLSAAHAALSKGASVLLVDREQRLGGILKQCIHNGFGIKRYREELTGPEYADREIACLPDKNIMSGTSVLEIRNINSKDYPYRVVATSLQGLNFVDAKTVVLATGSRERGFGSLNIPGDRPSGIFTAGSAQNLMNLQGCLPGRKAVVLGSGDIGLIMARRMTLSGIQVLGVFEIANEPSGLKRNIAQCLDDFGIPLTLSATVSRVEGRGRLSAVWISKVDPTTKKIIPGIEQRVECDTLILSVGLIPENEIAKSAGIRIDPITGGAIVDDSLQTNIPGIFACGNALHIHDLADYASEEGAIAGKAAAQRALGQKPGFSACMPVTTSDEIRYVVPQKVSLCASGREKINISLRTTKTLQKPKFFVEAIMKDGSAVVVGKASKMIAVPAEMVRIPIKKDLIQDAVALVVRVEERP